MRNKGEEKGGELRREGKEKRGEEEEGRREDEGKKGKEKDGNYVRGKGERWKESHRG